MEEKYSEAEVAYLRGLLTGVIERVITLEGWSAVAKREAVSGETINWFVVHGDLEKAWAELTFDEIRQYKQKDNIVNLYNDVWFQLVLGVGRDETLWDRRMEMIGDG